MQGTVYNDRLAEWLEMHKFLIFKTIAVALLVTFSLNLSAMESPHFNCPNVFAIVYRHFFPVVERPSLGKLQPTAYPSLPGLLRESDKEFQELFPEDFRKALAEFSEYAFSKSQNPQYSSLTIDSRQKTLIFELRNNGSLPWQTRPVSSSISADDLLEPLSFRLKTFFENAGVTIAKARLEIKQTMSSVPGLYWHQDYWSQDVTAEGADQWDYLLFQVLVQKDVEATMGLAFNPSLGREFSRNTGSCLILAPTDSLRSLSFPSRTGLGYGVYQGPVLCNSKHKDEEQGLLYHRVSEQTVKNQGIRTVMILMLKFARRA